MAVQFDEPAQLLVEQYLLALQGIVYGGAGPSEVVVHRRHIYLLQQQRLDLRDASIQIVYHATRMFACLLDLLLHCNRE